VLAVYDWPVNFFASLNLIPCSMKMVIFFNRTAKRVQSLILVRKLKKNAENQRLGTIVRNNKAIFM
jgi:hypothetical protein